jgi:hypothetical protein
MSQKLYLWKIYQNENNGYDTYNEAIVVAPDEETARNIHPAKQFPGLGEEIDLRSRASRYMWSEKREAWMMASSSWSRSQGWCEPKYVNVILVGEALPEMTRGHVVCASFNAG